MPDSSAPNPPAVAPLSGVCQSRNFKIQYVRSSPRNRCMRLDDGNLLRWSSIRNRRCTQPPSKGAVGARPGACGHPSRSPDRCRRHAFPLYWFHTRIWHSSWGGGANRRQMAWMMRTAPRMQWEIDRIAGFLEGYAQKWSKKSGRLISDRLFETADEQRMKKIQFLKDLGA